MKSGRQPYPRINCVVAGCKRGTTKFPPNEDGSVPQMICGPHWRTVPKSWRRAMAFYRRRAVAAARVGNANLEHRAAHARHRGWERILAMLNNPDSVMDGDMPATLATQLKADGLL